MRLAISNIAWRPEERLGAYARMSEAGAAGLEIAPGLAFPDEADAFVPSAQGVQQVMREIETAGLRLVSMQSLLFGVPNARLFGDTSEVEAFENGLARAITLAHRLSIPNLVFGSPAARVIPEGMTHAAAEAHGISVFRRLGDRCVAAGSRLALEPNAPAYGTNFLNTIEETIEFARRVDHPGVSVNFDIGALHMSGEFKDAARLFQNSLDLVSHVHISEPELAPAPADPTVLRPLMQSMAQTDYCGWYSIEMRAVGPGNLATVTSCIQNAIHALSP